MEALVTSFVAAFLAGWGDRTQLVAAMLAGATRRPGTILVALVLAAVASNVIAAAAGVYVAATVNIRAMTLLTALALLFAGASGLIPRRAPTAAPLRRWLLPSAFILLLAAEFGDRTQFLTFALAGRMGSAPLAAAGAVCGTLAACLPALLLGERLTRAVPVRALRYAAAALFLLAGFVTAVQALRLA